MKVKICGLTNKEDATWALNYGADFLGFNFWKESPRHISLKTAQGWVPHLPPFANTVGVFVNATEQEIIETVVKVGLKGVQLHGDESPAFVSALRMALDGTGRKVFIMKAFRVATEEDLQTLGEFADHVDYFLLDSRVPDQMGGTGVRFNWELAIQAKTKGKPVFLAGGLTPENVREAVKKVDPYAVDVASGVEKSPKRKDLDRMKEFISGAKK